MHFLNWKFVREVSEQMSVHEYRHPNSAKPGPEGHKPPPKEGLETGGVWRYSEAR
jgi:hypothetical protein